MTPLGERPLAAVFPVGELKTVEFAQLTLKDTPNQYLICPSNLCGTQAHAISPVFDVSVDQLRNAWQDIVSVQPRVELLAEHEGELQLDFVQRSARFRFPDIITVRFIPVSASQSTIAIYSRSIYGRSDLGVNRERIEAWLSLLRERL